MTRLSIALAARCSPCGWSSMHAQDAAQVEKLFASARHQETTQGDLRAAIETYRKVVAQAGSNRSLAAQALLRIGECHTKLGDAPGAARLRAGRARLRRPAGSDDGAGAHRTGGAPATDDGEDRSHRQGWRGRHLGRWPGVAGWPLHLLDGLERRRQPDAARSGDGNRSEPHGQQGLERGGRVQLDVLARRQAAGVWVAHVPASDRGPPQRDPRDGSRQHRRSGVATSLRQRRGQLLQPGGLVGGRPLARRAHDAARSDRADRHCGRARRVVQGPEVDRVERTRQVVLLSRRQVPGVRPSAQRRRAPA